MFMQNFTVCFYATSSQLDYLSHIILIKMRGYSTVHGPWQNLDCLLPMVCFVEASQNGVSSTLRSLIENLMNCLLKIEIPKS